MSPPGATQRTMLAETNVPGTVALANCPPDTSMIGPPKRQASSERLAKPVPATSTIAPPANTPELGSIESTCGASRNSKSSEGPYCCPLSETRKSTRLALASDGAWQCSSPSETSVAGCDALPKRQR